MTSQKIIHDLKEGDILYITKQGEKDDCPLWSNEFGNQALILKKNENKGKSNNFYSFQVSYEGHGSVTLDEEDILAGWILPYNALSPSEKTELNQIRDLKKIWGGGARGLDHYFDSKEKKIPWNIPVQGKASISFEEDVVQKPNHYMLIPEKNVEVKHITKALMDQVDDSDCDISSYGLGWLMQALQYQLRFHRKNGIEDLRKARESLDILIKDYDSLERH